MELDLAGMHQLAIEQGIDLEQLDAALEEALRLGAAKLPVRTKVVTRLDAGIITEHAA